MNLNIGHTLDGKPFTLPEEALVQTFALGGIRGSGKTTALSVMCEELLRAGLPWIMLDPVGVGWGLRAGKDGKPQGGLPVVVFGGEHGDLPLAKDQGARIAEAIIESGPCSVIDLSRESKTTWRKFLTDFCLKLMDLNPPQPRHIFIEEAAEFCPQRTKVAVTAACKEAVERLVRLGRNRGYGCTIVFQRPATVDKDILSQCENLIILRTVGKHDRKACMEWLEPKWAEQIAADPKGAKAKMQALVASLASMPDGKAYFWSPSWLRQFEAIQIRDRNTFHPGATRRDMRGGVRSVEMLDAHTFVEKMKGILSKKQIAVPASQKKPKTGIEWAGGASSLADTVDSEGNSLHAQITDLNAQLKGALDHVASLEAQLREARERARRTDGVLNRVRDLLRPQWDVMHELFLSLDEIKSNGATVVDRTIYQPWLKKAGAAGCRRFLELLIERGELTQRQLSTLGGVPMNSTFRRYRAWLTGNSLAAVEGDGPDAKIKLLAV